MKRIMILALVVVIAGAAFADVDPAFSGSFSTYIGVSIPEMDSSGALKTDVSDAMSLELNATIDEWNTVSVKVGVAEALYWDDLDGVGSDDIINTNRIVLDSATSETTQGANEVGGDELDNRDDYLRMDAFTYTTDILGALGVDGPVGLSIKFGKFGFGDSASYVNVAPVSTEKADGTGGTDDGNLGIGFDFKLFEKATLSTVIYPENLAKIAENGETRFEGGATLKIAGIADMLDFAAYFVASSYDERKKENAKLDTKDEDGMSLGASLALTFDAHKIGLGFQYNLDDGLGDDQAKVQIDYAVTLLDKLTLGLSYGIGGFNDIGKTSDVRLSVLYNILDNFGVFGAIGLGNFSDLSADSIKYDVGLTTALGALAIQLGASNNLAYNAPEDDWNDVIYVKFSTSF